MISLRSHSVLVLACAVLLLNIQNCGAAEKKQRAAKNDAEMVSQPLRTPLPFICEGCEEFFKKLTGNLWKNAETGSVFDMQLQDLPEKRIGKEGNIIEYSGYWIRTSKEGARKKIKVSGTVFTHAFSVVMIFDDNDGIGCAGDVQFWYADVMAGDRIRLWLSPTDSVTRACPDDLGDWYIYPFQPK